MGGEMVDVEDDGGVPPQSGPKYCINDGSEGEVQRVGVIPSGLYNESRRYMDDQVIHP